MKKSIGIRVTPDCVYYSIATIDESIATLISADKIKVAKSLEFPEQLKIIRTTLLDIINENDISFACIRITEQISRTLSIPRISIEGVIQELLASSNIIKYKAVQIKNMTALLNMKSGEIKSYIDGTSEFARIENFSKLSKELRESTISALSAFYL